MNKKIMIIYNKTWLSNLKGISVLLVGFATILAVYYLANHAYLGKTMYVVNWKETFW